MKFPDAELLVVLIAAAESRNLTEAAEKLKISQAAVSVKLKILSAQAPLPIFSYEGKRKVLTHYGRELYEIAKNHYAHLQTAFEGLNRQYASAASLTLKVGSRQELFAALAPRLRFAGKVVFQSMSSLQATQSLLNHQLDIAISYSVPNSPNIVAKKVLESSAKFVVHKRWLKGKSGTQWIRDIQFLSATPCVLYLEHGHLIREWTQHLRMPFEALQVSAIAENWRSVQALVNDGWGYGIVPSYIESSSADILSIAMPEAILPKYVFYAMYSKDLKKIPAFKDVLAFSAS